MIIDRLSDLLNANSFRPFRIRTGDAKSIPVLHPEVVFITPKKDTVIVTKEQGGLFILEPQAINKNRNREGREGFAGTQERGWSKVREAARD